MNETSLPPQQVAGTNVSRETYKHYPQFKH